jgi:hypothetical protein
MWVSLIQSIEELNWTKRWNNRKPLLFDYLRWNIGLFCLWTQTEKKSSSWVLILPPFRLTIYTISSLGSSACRLQILVHVHLHNYMSQFLINNPSIIYCFFFSGDPWLIQVARDKVHLQLQQPLKGTQKIQIMPTKSKAPVSFSHLSSFKTPAAINIDLSRLHL